MRGFLLLATGAAASLGAALVIGAGVGAQTVDGLDLSAVRARAKLDPDAAAAFEQSVLHRGERFRADADLLSAEVRASQARQSKRLRSAAGASGVFDFDAMVASASRTGSKA